MTRSERLRRSVRTGGTTPDLAALGVYPPVGALSRLMRHGAGPGRTRDDHLDVAANFGPA